MSLDGQNQNRGPGLLAIEVVLTPIALLVTVIRIGVRKINYQTGWDDAAIGAAMVRSYLFITLSTH